MHAGQDLDEGRFAGAVVSEQAEHLARVELKRTVGEHLRTREAL
jgi:hypothetical protein